MSKLAHSCEETMEIIERMAQDRFDRGEPDEPYTPRRTTENRDMLTNPATQPERFSDEAILARGQAIIDEHCREFEAKYRAEFKRIFGHELGAGI